MKPILRPSGSSPARRSSVPCGADGPRCRRGGGRPGGAAACPGSGRGRPSPGRGSSPSGDARRCRSSPARAGWCGGRSRSRRGAGAARRAGPRGRAVRPGAGLLGVRLQVGARKEEITAVRRLADDDSLGDLGDRTGRELDDGEVGGAVGDFDAVEELHRLQVGDQRLLGVGFGVHPHRRAVVHEVQRVLDVAVGREDQRLGGAPRREVGDVLGEQEVQPGEAVVAGDGDDSAVREVHEAEAVGKGALLTEQVAVVGGDAFVHTLGRNGAGQGQEGALHGHTHYDRAVADFISVTSEGLPGSPCSGRRWRSASCPSRSRRCPGVSR